MNKSYLIIIAFFIFLIQFCNPHTDYETKVFETYLMDQFTETIPNNNHTYLIVSEFHCSGCLQKIFTDIYGKVRLEYFDSLTILTYDSTLIPEHIRKHAKVLLDKDVAYEYIGLSIANVTVVRTKNCSIKSIEVINLDDITSFKIQ